VTDLAELFIQRSAELAELQEAGMPVCGDSTPVLFFGELEQARLLTVGINPSWQEFCSPGGAVLASARRRFAHSSDLGPGSDAPRRALDAMREYFGRNPYQKWFARVAHLAEAFGCSLPGGTAAHTDIASCFATDPPWSGLSADQRTRLCRSGFETFAGVVANAPLVERLVLIGGGARESMIENTGIAFRDLPTPLDDEAKFGRWRRTVLCAAEWQTPSGRPLPVLAVNPYLNGTPFAPLSLGEIARLPAMVRDAGWLEGAP